MFNVQHPDDWAAFEQDYKEYQEVLQEMAEDKTQMEREEGFVDVSELWRAGYIEEEALGFAPDVWVIGHNVTIKPGESIQAMEEQLAKEYGTRVRIVLPTFLEEQDANQG